MRSLQIATAGGRVSEQTYRRWVAIPLTWAAAFVAVAYLAACWIGIARLVSRLIGL